MQYGDLIVIGEDAVTIISKDATNPGHAQTMEFGGSQRADAGAAVDVDPLRHRPQDFLMPDRRRHLEIAVDDADDRRAGQAARYTSPCLTGGAIREPDRTAGPLAEATSRRR